MKKIKGRETYKRDERPSENTHIERLKDNSKEILWVTIRGSDPP